MANSYFQRAVDRGFVPALVHCGDLQRESYSDYERAMEYYQRALDAGYHSASLYEGIAEYYYHGEMWDEALEWWKKAEKAGSKYAIRQIGGVYVEKKKDLKVGIEWLELGGDFHCNSYLAEVWFFFFFFPTFRFIVIWEGII